MRLDLRISHTGNLFSPGRAGQTAVRADDLLAIRVETRNLQIIPGQVPKLSKTGAGTAFITLHFPPQAITEETFFEAPPPSMTDPDVDPAKSPHPSAKPKDEPPGGISETVRTPPIRARIAGESRLVFKVPDGFTCDYTIEGVLAACLSLQMSVAANARPRGQRRPVFSVADILDTRLIAKLAPKQKAALSALATSTHRIAIMEGDTATLRARQFAGGTGLRAASKLPLDIVVRPPVFRPRPANPGATQTALEIPWRLILSPHDGARWRHAAKPVTSQKTNRTELWHSTLVTPASDGTVVEPPHPDATRTVRAIWALTGEGSEKEMSGTFPDSSNLPDPSTSPFRMPMDDFDRFQVTHLSSNFSVTGYTPEPVDTNLMMVTALGGWLDSRGAWEPPGLSVEEWVHRAAMARDHYVKMVYRGFLFPFGHRVSLVKVSERKFHNGVATETVEPGNAAYLRQRLFIIVREKERRFDEPAVADLHNNSSTVFYARQFPFSKVRILTDKTPNLDDPATFPSTVQELGQLMFWPHVGGNPFRFECVATDLDGRRIAFSLPLIFMDNTRACPRKFNNTTQKLDPDFDFAEDNALIAVGDFASRPKAYHTADLKLQRVALAGSLKAGDTSVQAAEMRFGGEAQKANSKLRGYSDGLNRPVFFPKVGETISRIGAMAHLGGANETNRLTWHPHFLQFGFESNKGQVFVKVENDPGMAKLDFSAQGNRSGGFVQPNLKPAALSRLAGPVMGDVSQFITGNVPKGSGFPTSVSDLPLPLIFGCIPLGALIDAVADLTNTPERIPKFGSEAATQLEDFINTLVRVYSFVTDLASGPAGIAKAAANAFMATLEDQKKQAKAYAAAQVAPVLDAIDDLSNALVDVASKVGALIDSAINTASGAAGLVQLPTSIAQARAAIVQLKAAANAQVGGVSLPAGFRQSVLNLAAKADAFLADLEKLPLLVQQAKALFDALDAIVGQPDQLGSLLSNPGLLKTRIEAVANAIGPLKGTLASFTLMDGAPAKAVSDALGAVEEVLGSVADLLKLVEMLTGEELTIRFDWNPEISSWPAGSDPIFRANDKRGFSVAVEAKVKKNGSSSPKITVVCGLKHFDLVLIGPAAFIELNFEKIEFTVDTAAKTNVDVLLSDIKFVGPLSFVETLRDLIPLDGFSDPPYLDISEKGIDAGFDIALPSICVGVLNIANLSLGAGFTVPFIGQPLSVRFNFCTREKPFLLTVYIFGGGGFFGITIDPQGVQILEASFEFGASVSIDFGVASGGVHVMAGIYFRMEKDAATLTGYFRLGGYVDVLGLISASLELYLELRYETQSGKCVGKAQLTIEIKVFIFSGSVTITCERKFAGANGDPTFRQMLGFMPELSLADELAAIDLNTEYAWREHCEAFA